MIAGYQFITFHDMYDEADNAVRGCSKSLQVV
jgi:hypothetical protein